MLCPCVLQVAAESLVSYYRGMKRLKATCWFAQTVLSSHWYEPATQRNAVPGNAKWRKTSTAGELYFVPVFIWFPAHGFFYNQVSSILLLSFWYLHIFLVLSVVYLSTTSWVFFRAFNFQRHSKKCHLLPFDRFTNNVQKQASINFTLYEKKGKWQSPKNNSM